MPRALSTDLYQLTMAAGYHASGQHGRASFELSVRELPPSRGFLVAAGLDEALTFLETASFTDEDIGYLRSVPALHGAQDSFFTSQRICCLIGERCGEPCSASRCS